MQSHQIWERVGGVQYVRGGRLLEPELPDYLFRGATCLVRLTIARVLHRNSVAPRLPCCRNSVAQLFRVATLPSPHLHASSPPDEQDARLRIFLLLCGKCLTSRFHIKQMEHSHECHYRTRYQIRVCRCRGCWLKKADDAATIWLWPAHLGVLISD